MEESIENMTMRDYFAAKASGSIYSFWVEIKMPDWTEMEFEQWVATQAYMLADAMLMARSE